MHEKQANSSGNRAAMIRYQSHKQLPLTEFDWPFQTKLDENNRWVKLGECIPWDDLAEAYYQNLSEPLRKTRAPNQRCATGDWRGNYQTQALSI